MSVDSPAGDGPTQIGRRMPRRHGRCPAWLMGSGQGCETALAQAVAEGLGVAAERQPLTPAAIFGLLAHAGASAAAGLAARTTR